MAINMWLKTLFFLIQLGQLKSKGFGCTTSFQAYWKKLSAAADDDLFTAFCNHSERARATAAAGEEIRERHRGRTRHTVCVTLQPFPRPTSAHDSTSGSIRHQAATRRRWRKRRIIKCSSNDLSDWPSLYRPINLSIPCDACIEKCHSYRWRVWRRSSFKTSGLYLRSSGCIEAYDSQWEEVHALLASRQC